MLKWPMYSEIKQLKRIGLKKSQVARKLGLDRKTVDKYWELDSKEFSDMKSNSSRTEKLSKYKDVIVGWLREFPDMSASQVHDWLKEHYGIKTVGGRTVRRYVNKLRVKHKIVKKTQSRQYQAVAEKSPGKQMQVDFGQTRVKNRLTGGTIKLYVMAVVLSFSRYKYCYWSEKPFNAIMLVQALNKCFEYFNGMTFEMVFDQDRLLAVSENYGDIIYTAEFERFKQAMGFKVRLCRKHDPESKGKIEAVVKYVKSNFAKHRSYSGIKEWNEDCLSWLERTGNKNVHGTTKEVPVEMFKLEQKHLNQVPQLNISTDIVTRTLRKDNTLMYKSNRYTVPLGTYAKDKKVRIEDEEGVLYIYDIVTNELIANHAISYARGALIQNRHHLRDNSKKIDQLLLETLHQCGETENARQWLLELRRVRSRYIRDQLNLVQKLAVKYPPEVLDSAITFCLQNKLFSAVDCRDIAEGIKNKQVNEYKSIINDSIPHRLKIKAQKRQLSAYSSLIGGDN